MKMMNTLELARMTWCDALASCYEYDQQDHEGRCPNYDDHLIECYEEKISELTENFIASVEANGFLTPIYMRGNSIANGHHRLVLALLMDIPEVPVTDTTGELSEGGVLPQTWDEDDLEWYPENGRQMALDFAV